MQQFTMNFVEDFVAKHLSLLKLEQEAEVEQSRRLLSRGSPKDLERKGVALIGLCISSRRTGLNGRILITLERRWKENILPSHSLSQGDIVGLELSQSLTIGGSNGIASGVVSNLTCSSLTVAFDREGDEKNLFALDGQAHYRIVKLANDVTYRRLKHALHCLKNFRRGPAEELIRVLFKQSNPAPLRDLPALFTSELSDNENNSIVWFNPSLDASQKDAVAFALCRPDVAVIHGPPGTGKTTTITEVILQLVRQKQKILCCAPSNVAVDNLAEKLMFASKQSQHPRLLRLGHPARLTNSRLHDISLDALVSNSDDGLLAKDVRDEIDLIFNVKNQHGTRQRNRDIKELRKELRDLESRAVERILGGVDVVLATTTTGGEEGPLKRFHGVFDVVIVDECAQAIEASCWNPLLLGKKAVLSGDHLQLPPTITSVEAANKGLATSLMERILARQDSDVIVRMLTTQYRMHEHIMRWPSRCLYSDRLVAASSVAHHLLVHLRPNGEVTENDVTSTPLMLIDTAGTDMWETDGGDDGLSKGNKGEAEILKIQVADLLDSGVKAEEIAIITPYNLQVEIIRNRVRPLSEKIEIMTVDGFQGRENEAILISLVRSNSSREVGFLSEDRRLNVAVTRARRHLTVVCDSSTVGTHHFIQSLLDHIQSVGDVKSAQEFIDAGLIPVGEGVVSYAEKSEINFKPDSERAKKKSPKKLTGNKMSEKPSITPRKVENLIPTLSSIEVSEPSPINYLLKMVEDFAEDDQLNVFEFSPSLTPKERAIVHEVASKKGLFHESVGEGAARRLVLRKNKPTTSKSSTHLTSDQDPNHLTVFDKKNKKKNKKKKSYVKLEEEDLKNNHLKELTESENPEEKSDRTCDTCQKLVLLQNFALHRLKCQRLLAPQSAEAANSTAVAWEQSVKKKKYLAKRPDPLRDGCSEDFDELIKLARLRDNVCNFDGCKAKIQVLGQTCEFCTARFCLKHHMAEIHGCGDNARIKAKQTPRKDKEMDPTERVHIHRKLEARLNDMEQSRKPKVAERK